MEDGRWMSLTFPEPEKNDGAGLFTKKCRKPEIPYRTYFYVISILFGWGPPTGLDPTCTKSNPAPPPGGDKNSTEVSKALEKKTFFFQVTETPGQKKILPESTKPCILGPLGEKVEVPEGKLSPFGLGGPPGRWGIHLISSVGKRAKKQDSHSAKKNNQSLRQ